MLKNGCYWSPTTAAVVDTPPPDVSMPDSSLSPEDPDLISSDEQPSLLPSPDSICSLPNSQDPSNQEGEEGSPTQASESAAPSAGTVPSSGEEEKTPVHEISSGNSPKAAQEGGEDREEEAPTDDSVVEQQEEKEATSIWEVNDSSSERAQIHSEPGPVDRGRSLSATPPPTASPCAHTDEPQDAPPPEDTGAAKVTTEPADSTAGPSGLLRHSPDHYAHDKVTEGDCPSSCPSAERTEAGAGTPGALVLKGMRRRWQQASLARVGEPVDRGDLISHNN